jgi:hypothetical protein
LAVSGADDVKTSWYIVGDHHVTMPYHNLDMRVLLGRAHLAVLDGDFGSDAVAQRAPVRLMALTS